MTLFIQQIINGIALGSVYALTAIGYSMVYGVLELVNFAHGNVYMAGAFIYYLFAVSLGLPWWLSFLLTILVTGLFGVFYDAATLRPLRRAGLPKFTGLISSIGVSTVIYNLFFLFLGSETRMYPTFFEGQQLKLGSISVNYIYIVIVAVSVVTLLLLTLFINKTRVGMAMRAVAQSTEAAECMGISTNMIVSVTFFIGSALAAISGILSCMSYRSIDISIGTAITIKAFAATVLGGVGNLPGAVVGAFVISIAEVLTAGYISSNIRSISSFVILILVLLFRPNGLMGKSVQKKV